MRTSRIVVLVFLTWLEEDRAVRKTHIFCAISNGIGGEEGPTDTASAEGLGMGCMIDTKGVDGVIILMTALVVELGVTVKDCCWRKSEALLTLPHVG